MAETDTQQDATHAEDAGPNSSKLTHELWEELERAQHLASQVSTWSSSLAGLAMLELRLALSSIPKMLGVMAALIPLAYLTWITLCLLLAWAAYVASDIPTVGFATLFGLQLVAVLFCVMRLKSLRKQASMRETREQLQLFLQELKDAHKAGSREHETGNTR